MGEAMAMVEAMVTQTAAMAAAALALETVVATGAEERAEARAMVAVAKVAPEAGGAVQMADRNDQAHEAEVKAMVEVAMVEEAMAAAMAVVRGGALRGVAVDTCGDGYRSQGRIRPPTARASPWSPVHRSHPH